MPIDEEGRVYLTFWRGIFVWLCIALYMGFWATIGWLFYWFGYETTGTVVAVLGEGTFGVVPIYFFGKEEKKYLPNSPASPHPR